MRTGKFWRRLRRPDVAALGLMIPVIVFLWWRGGPQALEGLAQSRNLKKANAHALLVRPLLLEDERFDGVTLGSYTGGFGPGGCLLIGGSVPNGDAAIALRDLILSTAPPVDLAWALTLESPPFGPWDPAGVRTPDDLTWCVEIVPR